LYSATCPKHLDVVRLLFGCINEGNLKTGAGVAQILLLTNQLLQLFISPYPANVEEMVSS